MFIEPIRPRAPLSGAAPAGTIGGMTSDMLELHQLNRLAKQVERTLEYHRKLLARAQAVLDPRDPIGREAERAFKAVWDLHDAIMRVRRKRRKLRG